MTNAPTDGSGRVANITERGRARRRSGGMVWGAASALLAAWIVATQRGGWWCAAIGITVAMSALGFLQARERT